jgi:6-pyruvoyl-tetrahydropterin synthase
MESHDHDFLVTLYLQATRRPEDMYGLDMVETEELLKEWGAYLPNPVNDCPECSLGTTEQLCSYFAQIKLDSHIKIVSVSVSETSNRVTQLCLH